MGIELLGQLKKRLTRANTITYVFFGDGAGGAGVGIKYSRSWMRLMRMMSIAAGLFTYNAIL